MQYEKYIKYKLNITIIFEFISSYGNCLFNNITVKKYLD